MVEITIERLRRHFETDRSEVWFERRRPYLVQLGALTKCGRAFFGDPSVVAEKLAAADELYLRDLAAQREKRAARAAVASLCNADAGVDRGGGR
jgi:hypothetical protein